MLPVISSAEEHLQRLATLPRPNEENILAWYDHRLGAISRSARFMLVPLDDHLVHRGDGIFESIKYEAGRFKALDSHLDRMQRSAAGIYLEPPCSWKDICGFIFEVASAGQEPQGMIRVLLGRGPGGFGISPSECPQASLYIAAYRYTPKPDSWYRKGLTGFRTSIPAKQGYIARIKNANYLPNVLMTIEAQQRGADVPFCYDAEGFLAESAIANICLVKNGILEVPEFSNAMIGTTVSRALQLAERKLEHRIRKLSEADVKNADELLMFGSSPGCVAIVAYEGKAVGDGTPGPVSRLLKQLITEDAKRDGTLIPGLAQ